MHSLYVIESLFIFMYGRAEIDWEKSGCSIKFGGWLLPVPWLVRRILHLVRMAASSVLHVMLWVKSMSFIKKHVAS